MVALHVEADVEAVTEVVAEDGAKVEVGFLLEELAEPTILVAILPTFKVMTEVLVKVVVISVLSLAKAGPAVAWTCPSLI